ncbi:tetratricopeptide repeat protein [Mesorhizobium qingshengii]|uniref:Sel1 repeat-containing protein n=1 Tax=Mesorhizobium qingshengii TaxID=1165689 RepID=A0A1G5ZSV8_9HYPH|nr:tetratricopeptide repeat protein [Mesorhizobium qingshengii]SDA97657.1 Sel1 repeat-containing protein [Mesorhizobium qingshengii]
MPRLALRLIGVVAALVSLALAASAAALNGSDCSRIFLLMPEHPPRVTTDGFSVQPPAGPNWCGMLGLYYQSVDFFRLATDPKAADDSHVWLFARPVIVEPPGQTPHDLGGLLDLTRQWLRSGTAERPLMMSTSKLISINAAPEAEAPMVQASEIDRSIGLDCVRYRVVLRSGEKIGALCLDPRSNIRLIHIGADIAGVPEAVAQEVVPEINRFLPTIWLSPSTGDEEMRGITEAAARGLAGAQFSLGASMETREDYAEAFKWYRLAAEQHFPPAEHNVAVMYVEGRGVPPDKHQAEHWFRQAAEHGIADAHWGLGLLYANDEGDLQDFLLSYVEFSLAATLLPEGKPSVDAVRARDKVAALLTPEQVAEGRRRVGEWLDAQLK